VGQLGAPVAPEGQAADDGVLAAGENLEDLARMSDVARLAVDRAVEGDQRVDAEDQLALGGVALALRVLAGDLDRVALARLLDVRDDDLEGDAELLEDRPALGRAAG
jgi:hypothetical protein